MAVIKAAMTEAVEEVVAAVAVEATHPPGGSNGGRKIGRGDGNGGSGGAGDPFNKRKKLDDDLLDDVKYRDYWTRRHPNSGTPFSTHRRYWPNGDLKSIQTYDQFGRRYSRFDLRDTFGSPEHRHNWSYGSGRSGGSIEPHLPLDSVPN